MTEVVSVRFKSRGKLYFFGANGLDISDGSHVVVETSKGLELGECVYGNHWVTDDRIIQPLRPVIRKATDEDLRTVEYNKLREKEAFAICQEKIENHGLDMKLVDVECNFEGNKIIFFFASEGRVDFRELVKDLAGVFRTRIELRQIGVRDEAKLLGGLGICGRPFCCAQFLDDFAPVSTKMAKTQSMSLNPTKISGSCGRLMCCLRYEQEAYEDLVKNVPKNGAFVQTPHGYGNVTQVNLLRQTVKVRLDGADQAVKNYEASEVAAIPGGRPKPGDPIPDILKIDTAPASPAEEIPEELPEVIAEPEAKPAAEKVEAEKSETPKSASAHRRSHRSRKPKQSQPKSETAKSTAPAPQEKKPHVHPAKSKPAEQPARTKGDASGETAAPKKNDSRRRYFHRRPKAKGGE